MTTVGLEPTIFGSEDQRLIHWATGPIKLSYRQAIAKCKNDTKITTFKYFLPGLNRGPLACKASVITTRPRKLCNQLANKHEIT